jgi:outer membrane protein OmpA-like peptidoglycan-associated protein
MTHCSIFAQELIYNGDFEEENTCTEYSTFCSPVAWYSTSLNENAYGYARNGFRLRKGKRYSYFFVANMQAKTFLQTWLICPVQQGKTYRLSFDLRKNDSYDWFPIGVYFSNQFEGSNAAFSNAAQAQVSISTKDFKQKPRSRTWCKVSVTFVAPVTAAYMTIGNFVPTILAYNAPLPKWYFKNEEIAYDIDVVSLQSLDETTACTDVSTQIATLQNHHLRHRHNVPKKETVLKDTTRKITMDTSFVLPIRAKTTDNIPAIRTQPERIVLPCVFFEFDHFDIQERYEQKVLEALAPLRQKTFHHLEVVGHTDNIGNADYNLTLSQKRATTIAQLLVQQHFCTETQVLALGKGATAPVAENDTLIGRQQNRRVEILIY